MSQELINNKLNQINEIYRTGINYYKQENKLLAKERFATAARLLIEISNHQECFERSHSLSRAKQLFMLAKSL